MNESPAFSNVIRPNPPNLLLKKAACVQSFVPLLITKFFCIVFALEFISSIFSLEYSRFAQASLQVRRPSSSSLPTKPCDKPCFNGGSCLDGNCACPAGWTGPQCDSCFGRIAISTKKNTSSKGYLTDGPLNYSASAKCVWIIEGDEEGPLLLKLEEFFTECCWDHLLIYDGDNVFNNLIAAFSGNLPAGTQLVAKSGNAIIYFISDLAFNLPGFNVSYVHGACLNNCSGHGVCKEGKCVCENESFRGVDCSQEICLEKDDDHAGPCKNRGSCQKGKCQCPKQMHGDKCQEIYTDPVWDKLVLSGEEVFQPRASHKSVLIEDKIWSFGGMVFNTSRKSNELVFLDVNSTRILPRFHAVKTTNTPSPRYDHSMLVYGDGIQQKLYVFGGVIKEKVVTNELWCLDMGTMVWTLLSAHDDTSTALPMAVAGHTAHVIGDEMFVFFGYNPFEGFVFRVQIYSFEMKKWRKGDIDSSILGRFGHSSVLFREADKKPMVLIYGGYNAPLSGYSYSISDELILYDPTEQSWWNLGSTGMPPLFRHTAVMLDGIMLIVGGNSHNESSKTRQNDCYSSELLAFDTVCKEWLRVKINDSSQWSSRYGHSAVGDDQNMYIIGGFTGMMRNDVLKFTQGEFVFSWFEEDSAENQY